MTTLVCLGIYLEFHPGTNDRILKFAERCAQAGADRSEGGRPKYVVKKPHLTLYHAMVREPDLERIRNRVNFLHLFCIGDPVSFIDVAVFGDKFLFLDAFRSPQLRLMHAEAAMTLLPYLDRETVRPAQKEGLILSPAEQSNVETFGHPLVGPEYRPHVTLAYDENPEVIARCVLPPDDLRSQMIAAVRLGIMGEYGSLHEAL